MTFYIKEGDTSPAMKYELQDSDGNAVDIQNYNEVDFHMRREDSSLVKVSDNTSGNVSVPDAQNGVVKYEWKSSNTDNPGDYVAEFEVTYSNGSIETFPNKDNINVKVQEQIE